jgi:hypothetical protein
MASEELKKELYQLMAQSLAIQSLSMEKRLEMQGKMLDLPDEQLISVINILKNELRDMAELHRQSLREQKDVKKIGVMTGALRDAGKDLDRAFLTAREGEDREESTRITSGLLDQIDRI